MIDTIIFDVGRVLVNWDYESYLKRFAFGPEKTKAIAAATFEGPYWRQFDRGILTPEEIVKGFCSLAPEYTEEIKEVFAHCEETITPLPYAESWVRSLKEKATASTSSPTTPETSSSAPKRKCPSSPTWTEPSSPTPAI